VNENHVQTHKKRSGWVGFAVACLSLLLIAIPISLYWWHSDADLADVRKQAAANNIPVSWAEVGIKLSEPDRIARWKRIVALTNQLPSYQGLKNTNHPKFSLFSPIPEEMRAHHATLDEMVWEELLTELDLLGDQLLCFHDSITIATLMHEIREYRTLLRLLQERSTLAEVPEALRLCFVQLALCRSFDNNSLITHLVKTSLTSIALGSVSHHLAALKTLPSSLAEDISLTTELYPQQLLKGLTGQFLIALQFCAERNVDTGFLDNEYMRDGLFMPLLLRAGRHEFLITQIESLTYFRNHDLLSSLTWRKNKMTAFHEQNKLIPSPGAVLLGNYILSNYEIIIKTTYETLLKGRLMAAELRNQSWPPDLFDPTGAPLRPLLRASKIIGAYTVSSDGVDNGGDKKLDRYFPLYGPLELPVAPTSP